MIKTSAVHEICVFSAATPSLPQEDNMTDIKSDEIRTIVRERYASIARGTSASCCGGSAALGYTQDQADGAPEGADLGLGCGSPTAIASLRPGETVLDLGAGGGFDCFLAARAVGPTGKVIGVDMTPEMVALARANARKVDATNVDFRLGEIEHLPVADGSVDVILSNCVINLSPEKRAVFEEAFRVLRVGGRLAISDVVAIAPIPPELQSQAAALSGCISGAAPIDDVRRMLAEAGFKSIEVNIAPRSAAIVDSWLPGASRFIASATIEARRGADKACCEPGCCA
jgi:arsenite methyltransferase